MMTPADIENKVFKKVRIGGYEIKDVENFLEDVIEDYDKMFKEITELKDKCENLQESVCYYKSLENGIEQTINNAKEEAEAIKTAAALEFETLKIERDAIFNAEMTDMKNKVRQKEVELDDIKKQMQIYKIKVKSMLEAQIKILNETEE